MTTVREFREYFGDTETAQIAEMHEGFWDNVAQHPKMLDRVTLEARAAFIQEEVDELVASIASGDVLETIDALVDITVVVKGTAVLMGLRWSEHWDEVLRANKAKEVGRNPKRPDLEHDLIKPPGWTGPDHRPILLRR